MLGPATRCPACSALAPASDMVCPSCGFRPPGGTLGEHVEALKAFSSKAVQVRRGRDSTPGKPPTTSAMPTRFTGSEKQGLVILAVAAALATVALLSDPLSRRQITEGVEGAVEEAGDRLTQRSRRVFDPAAPSYIAAYLRSRATPPTPTAAMPAGRLFPVDIETEKLDADVYFALNDSVRARSLEEVGRVAFIGCERLLVGRYSDGAAAYKLRCEVTVIETSAGRPVGERSFDGGDPPQKKRHRGSVEVPDFVRLQIDSLPPNVRPRLEGAEIGSRPSEAIAEYLNSLAGRGGVGAPPPIGDERK